MRPGKKGRHLNPNAIPTIFQFPEHLQKKYIERKSPKKRTIEDDTDNIDQPSPSKMAKIVESDHSYHKEEHSLSLKVEKLTKQVKALKQTVGRRNRRIKNMNDLLCSLKEKQLVEKDQHELLNRNFGDMAKELFSNQARNTAKESIHGHHYTDQLKQFAMTLHYYSPKAYDFVCKILMLPHPASIRCWAASVDCNAGYLMDVIKLIGQTAEKNKWMSDVVLVLDAMALHKGTIWDPKSKQYVGTVDYGTAMPEVPDDLATEALVFMIVGVNGHFKHPIAYALQDKCTGSVQAQLIKDCIGLLQDVGLNVLAVVFDGCFTNQTTLRLLGCKMDVLDTKPWFTLPHRSESKIYVVLDICHMIKLMRNLWGTFKVICHEQNGKLEKIEWRYLEELHRLQQEIGFNFANKLKQTHMSWTKHKMNVKLAAQTFSNSVAVAIEYL